MAQTLQLIAALKKALKAHGKTYADIARHLGLSEASVKRLFSRKSFSLQRLDQICQMIGIEISDLVRMLNEGAAAPISALSLAQEQEIVGDLELLLITVCVLNRWTLREIAEYFAIPEVRCIKHLTRLDRLKMIELLPGNRVKLLVSANFKWRGRRPHPTVFSAQAAIGLLQFPIRSATGELGRHERHAGHQLLRGIPAQDAAPGPGIR